MYRNLLQNPVVLFCMPLVVLSLAGCGGGGDGGGGSAASVEYSGNTNAAVVTSANAARIAGNLFSGDVSSLGSIATGASIESMGPPRQSSSGYAAVSRRVNDRILDVLLAASRAPATQAAIVVAVSIDDSRSCDSGSVRTSGSISDSGTGTLTVTFNDCRTGDETLSGQVIVRVDAFDRAFLLPTDYTTSFSRLTVRGTGVSVDAAGAVHTQLSISTNTETITQNAVLRNNLTRTVTKLEDFVAVYVYDNIFAPFWTYETVRGRVFDSVQGFVDLVTVTPLLFSGANPIFPISGQLLIRGSGNSSIRLTALSGTLVALAVDIDGDGIFEINATLKWTELGGPVGADLADNDHDGMHNSWESFYGLDPNYAGDAALDKDGDGASNLSEYLAGTNPNDRNSIPPAVGLAIAVSDTPDPALVGGNVTYAISVTNMGSSPAVGVAVADLLPVGVNLISVTSGQGSCTGSAMIHCNLGTVNGSATAVISIVVATTVEGAISNSASVTSNSFDPDQSDNSATSVTFVGRSSAGIQALIDAAAPGAIITIAPGNYIGGLDFHGKDITLRSSDGPASTIINGNRGTGVRMGPAGAIQGFTITGSAASFGAGMEVIGEGSLILQNIFDGNAQGGGGFGAAIGGNNASPTILQNIFRNNSCDGQFLSGVVVLVNASSSLIANNVFEDNPCRAINMTLPQGNTPQVINNTFVGNRTAILVDQRVPQTTQIYRNNLIFQNGIGLEIVFGQTDSENPVWTNNLVFGNTSNYVGTADKTGTSGNISSDPLFVNAGTRNYRLKIGSPAIDAGTATGAPAVDFDGSLRPVDGNGDSIPVVDIGAFEAH